MSDDEVLAKVMAHRFAELLDGGLFVEGNLTGELRSISRKELDWLVESCLRFAREYIAEESMKFGFDCSQIQRKIVGHSRWNGWNKQSRFRKRRRTQQ